MKRISYALLIACFLLASLATLVVVPVTAWTGEALTDDQARAAGFVVRKGPENDATTQYFTTINDACWAFRDNTDEVCEFTLIQDATQTGWSDWLCGTRHWTFDLNGYTLDYWSTLQSPYGITLKNGTLYCQKLYFFPENTTASVNLIDLDLQTFASESFGMKLETKGTASVVNLNMTNVEWNYTRNAQMIQALGQGTVNATVKDSTLSRDDACTSAGWNSIFNVEESATFNIAIQDSDLQLKTASTNLWTSAMFFCSGASAHMNVTVDANTTLLLDSANTTNKYIYADTPEQGVITDNGATWSASAKAMAKGIDLPTATAATGETIVGYKTGDSIVPNGKTGCQATGDTAVSFKKVSFAAADFANVDGASIRLSDPYGIRFTTNVSKNLYDMLGGSADYGTLVIPTAKLGISSFTKSLPGVLDIPTAKWAVTEGETYSYRAALVGLAANQTQLNTSFSATAYVTVTYSDGTTGTFYAKYSAKNNARSLYDIAVAAQKDYPDNLTIKNVIEKGTIVSMNELKQAIPTISGSIASMIEVGEPAYEIVYKSIKKDKYTSYIESVLAAGFQQYTQNVIEKNVYTTFTKEDKYVLTVMWTGETTSFLSTKGDLRVLIEPLATTELPAKEQDLSYTPTHDTTLMQVGLLYHEGYGAGMSYVMQLDDGSFLVIDGGYDGNDYAERLYNILKHKAPDPENIVIAAWICTHDHGDHIGVIPYFVKNYSNNVTIEMFITNFPIQAQYADEDRVSYQAFVRAINTYYPSTPNVKARPGQVFYIRNAKVTMLYTADLHMPDLIEWGANSTSLVFSVEAEGTKFMCLGDTTNMSAEIITSLYGSETLKSDIIQVAHHGVNDFPPEDLYPLIDPEYVLWPMGRGPLANGTDGWSDFQGADSSGAECNEWFFESEKCKNNIYYADDDVDVLLLKDGEVVSITVYDSCEDFLSDKAMPDGNPWLN